jgi:ribonuclease P protein component
LRGCGRYEENISTQQPEAVQDPWVFSPYEHCRGKKSHKKKTGQGKKKAIRIGENGFPPYLMKSFPFPKEIRILKHSDFIRRSKTDRKMAFPHFLVIIKPNHLGRTRLGLTVGKKAGGAVRRNRIKRLLREFFRRFNNKLPPSQDIIIIALKGSDPLTYQKVVEELTPLLV